MSLHDQAAAVLEFVRAHKEFAAPIVFVLAFGESLAFISLLLPATFILIGVGAMIGAAGVEFWPVYFAAAIGAALGDWLSYWLGFHYHAQIARMWPLSRNPELLPKGHVFFEKWGWPGVFIGRFFGPLRAVVPLVAGACEMPRTPFQIANWTSAFVWAGAILGPGAFGLSQVRDWLAW